MEGVEGEAGMGPTPLMKACDRSIETAANGISRHRVMISISQPASSPDPPGSTGRCRRRAAHARHAHFQAALELEEVQMPVTLGDGAVRL